MNIVLKKIALSVPKVAKIYNERNYLLSQVSEKNDKINLLQKEIDNFQKEIDYLKSSGTSPILKDDFIGWIRAGIIGWCSDSNIEIIDDCIRDAPSGAIIEIGSFCGLSTSVIAHAMRRHKKNNMFYSTDDWFFDGYIKNAVVSESFSYEDWMIYTEKSFRSAVNLTTKKIDHSHFKLNSDEFFKRWESNSITKDINDHEKQLGGAISFAYIDGNHSYEQSKKDFINIDKNLVNGGYVFFDDSADTSTFGCKDVANEVLRLDNYKLISSVDCNINKCFIKLRAK